MQHSRGKSALIFCSTRKGAQEAAQQLTQTAMTFGHSNPFIKSREQQERLREASLSCGDKQMQSYILYGVGYHNGGLSPKDRNLIEGLFLDGDLQILCTTNTLAHGINLPAHTVVIKSTQHFNKEKGTYTEYDRSMILQMSGRAGRPPFDETGTVIIMTRRDTVHLYENLLNGCEMVESQLLPCITEHLTAEIVQLTIPDITRAIEWIKCSYLYVRMKKNPENYAVKKIIPGNSVEKHMQDVCVQYVNELSQYQMIWTDEDGFLLKPLEPGKLMTKYYLKFGTMKHIILAPATCSTEEALHIISRAEEVAWIQLRRNEKKLLNDINIDKDSRLRFHILGDKGKVKKRIQTREEKIFVLANDCLTGDPAVHDLSLSQDMNSICSNGCRVAKCMRDYFIHKKNYKGARNLMVLAKSLDQKLWDDSPYLLKQLPGIGIVTAKALHSMGINSFESLLDADPRKIEIVTGRKFPFGNHIKESLQSLPPKVEMQFEEVKGQRQGKSKLSVTLTRLAQSSFSNKRHFADMMISIEEDNIIIFHEKIRVDEFLSPYSATVMLPSPSEGELTANADLVFEEFVGIDIHQKVTVRKEIKLNTKREHVSKYSSVPNPREVCTIKDDDYLPSRAPESLVPYNSNELAGKSDTMPSFELLDEELEEAVTAGKAEDDECKIVTDKTVFDHIRKKARSLPAFSMAKNTSYPSAETLTLIKKRTRERPLGLQPSVSFPQEADKDEVMFWGGTIKSAELDSIDSIRCELAYDRYLAENIAASNNGKLTPEPEDQTERPIFDHMPKKAKNSRALGNSDANVFQSFLRTNGPYLKNQHIQTQALQHDEAIAAPDAMNKWGDTTSKAITDVKDALFYGSPRPLSHNIVQPPEALFPGTEAAPVPSASPVRKNLENHVFSTECNGNWSDSQSLFSRKCCSQETAGKNRAEDSFVGFQSIFSFL